MIIRFCKPKPALLDPLPPERVKEFVIAGHTDYEKTKQMLIEMPGLLYARWDWGEAILKLHWKKPAKGQQRNCQLYNQPRRMNKFVCINHAR